ncbi:MAG TPA: alpha/beta hydrolase [Tepidisphaeraceae bacterium]|jgi:acetyl esterase/lipase
MKSERTIELLVNVEYGNVDGRPLVMDILRPKESPSTPRPMLLFIHGGGWYGGEMLWAHLVLLPFVKAGYVTASVGYRLSDEAKFPAAIQDCKCAVRFARAHAKELQIDPARIGAWGSSAGGHLVALLGLSSGVPELEGHGGWKEFSSDVAAVCDFCGPGDLSTWKTVHPECSQELIDDMVRRFLGQTADEDPQAAAKASPVTYVKRDAPPFLIVHGTDDRAVDFQQSQQLYAVMQEAGCDVRLHPIVGAGHAFGGPEIDGLVRSFFDDHLKLGPRK